MSTFYIRCTSRFVVGALLGGSLLVGCSCSDRNEPFPDLRTPLKVTKAQRAVIGEVMRRNLKAIHQISSAAAAGDMRAVALLADEASKAPGPGGTDRALREKFPDGWREIGKGVDVGFEEIARAAQSGGAPMRLNAGMASLTQACVACHTTYRLDVESD